MSEIITLKILKDNFTYLVTHQNHAIVIDPGESKPVLGALQERCLTLDHILCTHHHSDHIYGIAEVVEKFHCPVWCSAYDRMRIPGSTQNAEGFIDWRGESIEVIQAKGHTLGHVLYYFPKLAALFVGDTLFSAGCGRLFEGSAEQMFLAMETIKSLPIETQIYFSHEYTIRNLSFVINELPNLKDEALKYRSICLEKLKAGIPTTPSTIEQEMKVNPFLASKNIKEFAELRERRNHF